MIEYSLEEILSSDPLGLLEEQKTKNKVYTQDERLLASFDEINDFFAKNGREPARSTDMLERTLFSRLQGIREHPEKADALKPFDKFGLLKKVEINSIDDILNDDAYGLLGDDTDSIFELKHVSSSKNIAKPDYIAARKPCAEFEKYEQLFKECHQDLRDGKRKLVKFNEKFLEEKSFFILKGIMVYLEKIVFSGKDKHNKMDGRTHCVFENGTQSDMTLRSFIKRSYEDGYFASKHEDRLFDNFSGILGDDIQTGFIYVLTSKSVDDKIRLVKDLYKIGYSSVEVAERIKNAQNEPTYLMAPVLVAGVYRCYNMNAQKFENLIHKFFAKACLNIDIFDGSGQRYSPREWFVVSFEVIELAIELIISGEILDYYYDETRGSILPKTNDNAFG